VRKMQIACRYLSLLLCGNYKRSHSRKKREGGNLLERIRSKRASIINVVLFEQPNLHGQLSPRGLKSG